ncbi:MAG: hypothetical protein K2K00_03705 [Muribaculaceae bacterium]|nr:hypothetical protein [Muribaculaceae bacterium]
MEKKYISDIINRSPRPRSSRLREQGIGQSIRGISSHSHPQYLTAEALGGYATEQRIEERGYAVKSWVETVFATKLDKSVFDDLFEKVTDENGTYIKAKYTLMSVGDVQSKKFGAIVGGGNVGGGDFSIMSEWDTSLAEDPDFVLSAGLGYDLYLNKLSKSEAEGLYQPKGNYALASALGDYVTVGTAQDIRGKKNFNADVKIYDCGLFFKTSGRADCIYIYGRSDSDKLQFAHHKNYAWQKNVGTLDINGNLTMNSFIRAGGTASQFLKADGSVDSNSYVKKSGDMMTGDLYISRGDNTYNLLRLGGLGGINAAFHTGVVQGNRSAMLSCLNGGDMAGSIGVKSDGTPYYQNAANSVYTLWHSGNMGPDSGLNADKLDGLHAASFLQLYDSVWNDNEMVGDWSKRVVTKSGLYTPFGWSWASSKYLKLGAYTIDSQRYSAFDFRPGNLNSTWQQKAYLFLPSHSSQSMIYIAQMTTESTTAVNTSVKRYADYDTVLDSNVASASKLATARNFCISDENGEFTSDPVNFDGSGDVTLKLPYIVKAEYLWASDSVNCYGSNGGLILEQGNASYIGALRVSPKGIVGINFERRLFTVENDYSIKFYRNLKLNNNSLWLDDTHRIWVENGVLRYNGTILADGDVQSKKAGTKYDEVVRINLGMTSDSTVSIPASASEAIITVWGDQWTHTIQLTGDTNDLDVLKITIYDYGAGGDTWKYGNTSITVTAGRVNVLALVNMKPAATGIRLMKLI